MVESRIDKRRFIEIHRFTVLVFIALAAGRLLYIAACATPLEVDRFNSRIRRDRAVRADALAGS